MHQNSFKKSTLRKKCKDWAENAGVAAGQESKCQLPQLPVWPSHPFTCTPIPFTIQPTSAQWYDPRDIIEFCVEDSKDVNANFEKSKPTFNRLGGSDILSI